VIELKKNPAKGTKPAECEEQPQPTTEELVAEDHFLLHTLLDLLIEKELISKQEIQDKLDSIESELFVDECEEKEKNKKTPKKK
jgi:hypothetical protein